MVFGAGLDWTALHCFALDWLEWHLYDPVCTALADHFFSFFLSCLSEMRCDARLIEWSLEIGSDGFVV